MNKTIETHLTSNKGFYVGDICYVLDDEIYDKVWGAHNYADGVYDTKYGQFAVASTAYGDGSYNDDLGNEYGVDAGVIGIVPWEILETQKKWKDYYAGRSEMENLNTLGHFFEGTEAHFEATGRGNASEDGLFEITIGDTDIVIHTEEDPFDYDEEEDDYEDDDDYYGGYPDHDGGDYE